MTDHPNSTRRTFLKQSATGAAILCLGDGRASSAEPTHRPYSTIAFIKFLQSLSYDKLATVIAELGFDGIEATVRRGGYVLPERVEEDLPRLVEALKKQDLEITVMASNINRVDSLAERVLRTAASLGVKCYRMENYRYDLKRPVVDQLREIRPALKDLVELNREIGISAVYQNHSGASYVGAALWDLHHLIKDYPAEELGVAFDIRHATIEGGLSWPTSFNLMQPHLRAVYIKDFVWDGRKPKHVPLGAGQVDPQFFSLLRQTKFRGPISLHVEYLPDEGPTKNIAALKNDLRTLKSLL